jgi:hypothetical protein
MFVTNFVTTVLENLLVNKFCDDVVLLTNSVEDSVLDNLLL